jgi:hypothetical protein
MLTDYANEPERGFAPEASNDPMVNIFNYFKIGPDWKRQMNLENSRYDEFAAEYDKHRLKYDGDARFYDSLLNDPDAALRGDTVTSLFTPYKEMLKRATGLAYHKTSNPFDELIRKRNEPGYKEVNDRFAELAELYHTPGNFMLLPHRGMNNARYTASQDRIDKSLFECFPGGELAGFFGNNDNEQRKNLVEWVKSQNLAMMFEDGIIERDRIIPLNKNNPFTAYQDMSDDELSEFIDNAVRLIKQRNNAESSRGCRESN